MEARPLTRLAYHNDVLVGAVCARIDAAAGLTADTHLRRLYIMTLGVLAPYRKHGIGPLNPNSAYRAVYCAGR